MASSSQVESIFFAALEKKAEAERSAYLEQACGGDSALRLRVEQLLEAHPQAQDFLAEPAVDRDDFEVLAEWLENWRTGQALILGWGENWPGWGENWPGGDWRATDSAVPGLRVQGHPRLAPQGATPGCRRCR